MWFCDRGQYVCVCTIASLVADAALVSWWCSKVASPKSEVAIQTLVVMLASTKNSVRYVVKKEVSITVLKKGIVCTITALCIIIANGIVKLIRKKMFRNQSRHKYRLRQGCELV